MICVNIILLTGLLTYASLPNWFVTAEPESTNIFKTRLDTFWHNQDIMYDFRAQLEGTGSRSEILNQEVHINVIESVQRVGQRG